MAGALSVVKVGGSLVGDRARLRAVLVRLAEGRDGPAVIVPGGGPFAEAVRAAQTALGFDDGLAHRLALDAMGRMAEVFRALEPRLHVVRNTGETRIALAAQNAAIWDPVDLRGGHPDIRESWDVTSDSLALWLAARLRATRCILLKAASCPADARPEELVGLGLVDRAFPEFAEAFAGEIVLRGPDGDAASARAAHDASSVRSHPYPKVPRSGDDRHRPDARGAAA